MPPFTYYHNTTMKNIFYTTITATAIMLAIALSNGKLGGMSDSEARRIASKPFSR